MTFDEAYDLTLTWEGGDRLHTVAGDPGGTTRFGLSQRAYPDLDMHRLTLPAASFYAKRDYWKVVRADEVPEELRWHLFDMAFNAGTGTSVRILQKSINLCRQASGREDYLIEDGVIGPKTLAAVDEQRPERLARVFKAYRVEHYLVVAETRTPQFIHGWLRRAEGERNG
jgi:lysozyme family protein